jgi:long-chain fatty acid transport protein
MQKRLLPLLVASALPFVASNANASAFALAEQGVSGLGNAYAGAAAVAEDASTVWWNPAGMARLGTGKHVAFAGFAILPSTKFNDGGSSTAQFSNPALNGNGGDAGSTAFLPNVFFAMALNPAWSFGVGVSVPFGLKTEYDANWVGRFQGIESEVKTVNVNPSVSYKLNDSASIGFGVSWQHGEIDLLSAVNYSGIVAGRAPALFPAVGANVEGQNKSSLDGDAWGFNIGGLFNVTPATRLGVHYRSSLKYEMEGSTTFTGQPAAFAAPAAAALAAATSNGDIRLDLKTPATASLSVAHKANDKLELLGDVTWTEWSKISSLAIVRTSGAASGTTLDTLVFNFEDTWRLSAGMNYKYGGPWTLKAGVAFDQSPVPNAETRSVRLPDNDRYWLSLGATYKMSQVSRLDIGYSYVMIKDADINSNQTAAGRGTVVGTYEANVHVFGVQYQHSF